MDKSLSTFLFNSNLNEIRDLLCNICNRYLSVAPVFYNNKLGNICGRCEESHEVCEVKKLRGKNAILERQKAFEFIAPFLTFPCSFRNNGCKVELSWEGVYNHERDCTFKETVCFLSDEEFLHAPEMLCEWTGESNDLVSHFSERHAVHHTTNPRIVLGLEASSILGPLFGTDTIAHEPKFQSKIFSFKILESIFIGILHYNKRSNVYVCNIFSDLSNQKCQLFEYQVELYDHTKKHSLVLPRSAIYSVRNYFHGKIIYNHSLEINLDYINKLLNMPHFLTAEFRILEKFTSIPYMPPLRSSLTGNELCGRQFIDENMKCSTCEEYLTVPIYLCVKGDNICESCGKDCDVCPSCSGGWCDGYRNFAMEKLISLINCACKNRSYGCLHVGSIHSISEHEKTCLIFEKSRNCFFKTCTWHGSNFRAHIKKHNLFKTDIYYEVKEQQFFFTFDNDIFAMEMNMFETEIEYMIVCCGVTELKYRYELQVIEGELGANTSKFMVNQFCQPEYTSFDTESVEIYVPLKLFTQLFSNCADLKFKINIFLIQDDQR
ncbi:hypothetical protein WA026_015082 [Henosepilachna vigintioctopunctata]|uniref:RING-type E3 ubiquitin transferase n=1 Tax=Henosepilachna vigintioctopunctata TaxID=420089 RepID=A0AAW1U881_9CUCU